jgi:hypothetical protein
VNALPAPAPKQEAPKITKPKLKVVEAAPAGVPDEPDTGEASQFEADLDAQLDALLPK